MGGKVEVVLVCLQVLGFEYVISFHVISRGLLGILRVFVFIRTA